ncbi:MAG: sulfatase-like hydrolase/transferase, partial [Myxococcota bacterium]
LDALAERGVVFENMWATPACTTTRASILTGQHGVHSGVTFVPASLRDDATTVQSFLRASPAGARYVNAVFGKWHVGGANPPPDHPNGFGVETYAGNVGGNLEDYFDWEMVRNQALERSTTYHTTAITDLALEWVMEQTRPWFLWVAYSAPHSPFHLPPSDLHSQPLSGNPADIAANRRAYYLTAIEAMDSEIGRLLESLPEATRDNTIVMFLGDNGTPRPVLDRTAFGNHGKNTLYEGGVRVPFIVAGSPLTRQGEREEALVNTTDLFATIATLTGATTLEHEDSVSFAHLLADAPGASRRHNYTEFESDDVTGWAVRNERYKLITFADGTQELYDVVNDIAETQNLLLGGGDFSAVLAELWEAAQLVRGGPMMAIDITGLPFRRRSSNCAEYAAQYRSDATDVSRNVRFNGSLQISVAGGKCVFATNEVPNHDFNDGARPFPNAFSDQSSSYEITAAPAFA